MKDFTGAVVSDCWTAYEKLDQDQQKCLGHITADLNEILVVKQKENVRIEKSLLPRLENLTFQPETTELHGPKKRGRPKKAKESNGLDKGRSVQLNHY
jgi:hypothetical protein